MVRSWPLASKVPPLMVNGPVPRAVVFPTCRRPEFTVVPPVYVLALLSTRVPPETVMVPAPVPITPLRISVPAPALVMPKVAPEILPPTVRVLALTVTVGLAFKVTAPVPRSNELLPVKVKLPFQISALFVELVMALPEVLSMIVPASIVKVPVPKAPALLISSVPALKVTPPSKLLLPDNARVPAPALMIPKPLPKIDPPSVKVFAVTVIVKLAFKLTSPVPMFNELLPAKVKLPFQF